MLVWFYELAKASLRSAVCNGTSDACTNGPLGEYHCIIHVAGCSLKIEIDLKIMFPRYWMNLMGFVTFSGYK